MSIIARKPEGDFSDYTPPSAGTHFAVCTIVADIGWQEITWNNQTKLQHKIVFRWEIPAERIEWEDKDGNKHEGPMVISKRYTNSLFEKANLRIDLESWRGRKFTDEELEGFDVLNVLGKACMLSVVHETKGDKTFANVGAVSGLPKGTMPPKPEGELIGFSWGELHKLDKLPKSMQNAINAAKADPNTQPMTGAGYAPEAAPAASQSMLPGEEEHYANQDSDLPF